MLYNVVDNYFCRFYLFFNQVDNFCIDYFLWVMVGGVDVFYEWFDWIERVFKVLEVEFGDEVDGVVEDGM